MADEDDEAFLPPGFLISQPDDCGIGALEAEITAEIHAGRTFLDTISPRSSANQSSSDKVLETFTGNQTSVKDFHGPHKVIDRRGDDRIKELQEDKANLIIETQKLELDLAMEKEEARRKLKALEDENRRLSILIENQQGTHEKLCALEERSKIEAVERESTEQTLLKQMDKMAKENSELKETLSDTRVQQTKLEEDHQRALTRIEVEEEARLQAEELSTKWQKLLADKRTNLDGTIRSLQRKMGAIENERRDLETELAQQTKALESHKESGSADTGLVDSLRKSDERILLMAEKIRWYQSEMEEKEEQISDLKERNTQYELDRDETELQRKLRSKVRRIGSLEAELEAMKEQYLEHKADSQVEVAKYDDEVVSLNSQLRKLEAKHKTMLQEHHNILHRSNVLKDRESDLEAVVSDSQKTIASLRNRLEEIEEELQFSLRDRDSLASQQAAFVDQTSQLLSRLASWKEIEGKDHEQHETQSQKESLVGVGERGEQDSLESAITMLAALHDQVETLCAAMLTSRTECDKHRAETLRLQTDVCHLQAQLTADRESQQRDHQSMLELERVEHKEELSQLLRDKYQTAEVARRAMEDVNKMVKNRLTKNEHETANLNALLHGRDQEIASLETKIRDLATVHSKPIFRNKQDQEESRAEASDNEIQLLTNYKVDDDFGVSEPVSPIPDVQLLTLHATAERSHKRNSQPADPVERRLDESTSSYDSFLLGLETTNNRPQNSFKPIAAEFGTRRGSRCRAKPATKSVPRGGKRDLPPSGSTVTDKDSVIQSPNSAFNKTKKKVIPSSLPRPHSRDKSGIKSANQSSGVRVTRSDSSPSVIPRGRRTSMLPMKTTTQKFTRIAKPSGLIPAVKSNRSVEELRKKCSSKAKSNLQGIRTAGIPSDRASRSSIGGSSRSQPLDRSLPTPSSRCSSKTQSKPSQLRRSETKQDKDKPTRTVPGGHIQREKPSYMGHSSLDSLLKENRAMKEKDLLRRQDSSAIRSKSIGKPISSLADSPLCSSKGQHIGAFLTTPGRIKRRLVGSFSPETPLVSPKRGPSQECYHNASAATLIQSTWRSKDTRRKLEEIKPAVVTIQSFTEARVACTALREKKSQGACNTFQFAAIIQRWWRMKKTRVGYRMTILSASVIQRVWRGFVGRVSIRLLQQKSQSLVQEAAAIRIQTRWRSRSARTLLTKTKDAVITLQSFSRAHLAYDTLLHLRSQRSKMIQAVVSIQGWWRMVNCRAEYERIIKSTAVIQAGARGMISRRSLDQIHMENRTAIIIQAGVRRHQQQCQYRKYVTGCLTIQRFIRSSKQSFAHQTAATRIQSTWRSARDRKVLMTAKYAAVTMQSLARMRAASSTLRSMRSQHCNMNRSASLIQCWWRMETCRVGYEKQIRSAIVLQNGMRSVISKLQLRRAQLENRRSAVLIQASVRRHQQQRQYRKYVSGCLTIQRFIRSSKQSFAHQTAATRIQSTWRSARDRKLMMTAKYAAVTMQSLARMRLARRRFKIEYSTMCPSAVLIQNWWRAERCRIFYATLIASAIILQKHVRGMAIRTTFRGFLLESRSALVLQSSVRRHQACRRFEDMRMATIHIQSLWRTRCAAQSFSRTKHAVVKLQSVVRVRGACLLLHRLHSDQLKRIHLALVIQTWWRMESTRLDYEKQIRSAVVLQIGVREMFVRMRLKEMQLATRSAIVIQAMARCHLDRSWYKGKVAALRIIQRWSRRTRQSFIRQSAAIRIQSKYRSRRACNQLSRTNDAAIVLQCLIRSRNAYKYSSLLRLQATQSKMVSKAVSIQGWWRMELCRSDYVKLLRSVVAIQKSVKCFLCRLSYRQTVLQNQSACAIQASVRCSLSRRRFHEKIEMCRTIQKWIRRIRKSFAQKLAATLIQTNWRTRRALNQLSTAKRAAIALQAFARARAAFFIVHHRRAMMVQAANLIQRFCRMKACRRHYLKTIRSVVAIQMGARRMLSRIVFLQSQLEDNSALVIQVRVRCWLAIRVYQKTKARNSNLRRTAATCLQSQWRKRCAVESYLQKKHAVVSIQSFARLCASKSIARRAQSVCFNKDKSAILIQKCWRKERSRAAYLKLIRATGLVQRCSRGMIGRCAATNLRTSLASSAKRKAAPKAKQSTSSVSNSKPRQVLGGLSVAAASSRSKRSAANQRSDNVANTSKLGTAAVSDECLKPAASVKRVTRSKANVRDEETSARVEEEASARSGSIRNEVSKLKVVDLRAELSSMGVPTKDYRVLRKPQLIEMLVEKRLEAV